MNVRQAIAAALRRDPDLIPKMTDALRARIDDGDGPMSTMVQAAEAIEPILAEAVRKRPSRLGKLGLRSAHLLASLTEEDAASNRRLAHLARGGTVGIAFVDVAGFTAYTDKHGDEAAIALLNRIHQVVERKVGAAGGECVKHLGDGYLLAFPSASQAVRGGVQLCEAICRQRANDRTFAARLRVAVHAGEPLIEDDDMLGHDVNLTARLLDHCKPDEVIVSQVAKQLAERRLRSVEFVRERQLKIRGLSGRVTVYTARPSIADQRSRNS